MSKSRRGSKKKSSSKAPEKGTAPLSPAPMLILSDAEVEVAARAVEDLLGGLTTAARGSENDVRDLLRFRSLASRCGEERESRGWSIKAAAAHVRCAQYRLRAVESSLLSELDPQVLERYVRVLELDDFFEEWARANPELGSKVRVARGESQRKSGRRGVGSKRRVYRIKITLVDVVPSVWRIIEVPATYSFWALHVAIQDAMGWLDYHLHLFQSQDADVGTDPQIGIPDSDAFEGDPVFEAGWEVPLSRWLKHAGDTMAYTYDFGDDWQHEIVLEDVAVPTPRTRYPRCVDGEGACPPEDCGGPGGYQELLSVLADRSHPEHDSMLEWLGGHHDPAAFDPSEVHFDDPEERWMIAFAGRNP